MRRRKCCSPSRFGGHKLFNTSFLRLPSTSAYAKYALARCLSSCLVLKQFLLRQKSYLHKFRNTALPPGSPLRRTLKYAVSASPCLRLVRDNFCSAKEQIPLQQKKGPLKVPFLLFYSPCGFVMRKASAMRERRVGSVPTVGKRATPPSERRSTKRSFS